MILVLIEFYCLNEMKLTKIETIKRNRKKNNLWRFTIHFNEIIFLKAEPTEG